MLTASTCVNPESDSLELVAAYDELPLWSAPFGLVLLEVLRLRPDLRLLDVGCGTGFPALELASRLGPRSRVTAVDPWRQALARARAKRALHRLENVELLLGVAEALPLADATFDAVVSNNGLNNVADASRVIAECHRVLRGGGQLVATMNLPDTMHELYTPLGEILRAREGEPALARLMAHIAARRRPVAETRGMLEAAGFVVEQVLVRSFAMRFADGTALFEHPFIRRAFLGPWREVPRPEDTSAVMEELRRRLDDVAASQGEVRLTVPFACFDARRA